MGIFPPFHAACMAPGGVFQKGGDNELFNKLACVFTPSDDQRAAWKAYSRIMVGVTVFILMDRVGSVKFRAECGSGWGPSRGPKLGLT